MDNNKEKAKNKPEIMAEITKHITNRYVNVKNPDNTINFNKLQSNQLYNAIEDGMDLSQRIMYEEMQLARLIANYDKKIKEGIIDNKTKVKYNLNNSEEEAFLNANDSVSNAKISIANQKAYIKYLKSILDFLTYYDKKVTTFLDIEKFKMDRGYYDQDGVQGMPKEY
jgi:hypothetical protein